MRYSFILCTLNRKELAKKSILSIIQQDSNDFEIIVVDQSEIEEEKEFTILDKRVKYIHSTKRGLSYNRNIGIRASKGEYICLMDDDATYDKNALVEIDKVIDRENIDIISGVVLDPINKVRFLKGMNRNNSFFIKENEVMSYCSSASLVLSSRFVKELLFDESFGVGVHWGCAEEVDLVLRLLYKGAKILYVPTFLVFHPSVDKQNLQLNKSISYSLGYGAVCAKHYFVFNNRYMLKMYFWALFKHSAAIVLSLIKIDLKMSKFYYYNLKAKIQGFNEYRLYIYRR